VFTEITVATSGVTITNIAGVNFPDVSVPLSERIQRNENAAPTKGAARKTSAARTRTRKTKRR
jgi:hypothetical protein